MSRLGFVLGSLEGVRGSFEVVLVAFGQVLSGAVFLIAPNKTTLGDNFPQIKNRLSNMPLGQRPSEFHIYYGSRSAALMTFC